MTETIHDSQLLDLAMQVPGSAYIWGPPGVGKSFAAKAALQQNGFSPDQIFQVNLAEDLTVQEMIGHYVPKGDRFVYQDGPISRAMKRGVLIINEIQRASASVQDYLLGILDSEKIRQIDLIDGTRLTGHPELRVIATSNEGPEALDDALMDRFDAFIEVTTPAPGVIELLNAGYKGLGDFINRSYEDPRRAISPRRGIAFLKFLAVTDEEQAAKMSFGKRSNEFLMTIRATKAGKSPKASSGKAVLTLDKDGKIVRAR